MLLEKDCVANTTCRGPLKTGILAEITLGGLGKTVKKGLEARLLAPY